MVYLASFFLGKTEYLPPVVVPLPLRVQEVCEFGGVATASDRSTDTHREEAAGIGCARELREDGGTVTAAETDDKRLSRRA